MNTHILYLNLIILSALVYPPFFVEIFHGVLMRKRGGFNFYYGTNFTVPFLVFAYWISLILVWFVTPDLFFVNHTSWYFYIAALALAPVIIFAEFTTGWLGLRLRGKRSHGFSVHPFWQNLSIGTLSLSLLLVVGEEMVFRQTWIHVLLNNFHVNILLVIIISSLVYALNHTVFGSAAIPQKFVSGLIYGSLYLISGNSILVPITTHYAQNVFLAVMGRLDR